MRRGWQADQTKETPMSNAPKSSRDHLTASATRDHLTASTTIKLTEQELNRVTGGATAGAGGGKAKFNEF